ncbi:MAG: hypothetical protein QOF89_5874 [Acidobacteriota bacterium]|jgi:hypothetical protein|nr:hypothetical protein [Acidobacteriota bacterium]
MRKTLMTATLAISMALMAVSTFAAIPAEPQRLFTPAYVAPPLVPQVLADEIFLPAPGVEPAPVFTIFRGVCNISCEECYGSCPTFAGLRQTCTFACN